MTTYVAFLRAVNVGGTGKMPMADLRDMCTSLGFADVCTYIASGNVVLRSDASLATVRKTLEAALQDYASRPVAVAVRTAAQLAAVLRDCPFQDTPPHFTVTIFLGGKPPADVLSTLRGLGDEQVVAGRHELYVHYPRGQANTRLRIPIADKGTARNMNTVAKMVALATQRR